MGGPPTGEFRGGTKRSEEIPGLRTRTSKTYRNDFGAFETDVFTSSVHYQTNDGWKPIDNTISAAGNGLENRANEYRLQLPKALGAAPVRFSVGNEFVTLDLEGAKGAPAVVRGNAATYAGVLEGVDVEYEALNDSVKEELLLASAEASSAFTWNLTTSPSLTAAAASTGGIDFTRADGSVAMSIPPPLIHDATGVHDGRAPAHAFQLVSQNGRDEIRLTVDSEWLSAPERAFPVTVDPTVTNGATRDCYIVDGDKSSQNFCSETSIKIGQRNGYHSRALLRFDVSGIPDSAEILVAKLEMSLQSRSSSVQTEIAMRPLVTTFTEDGATWNNARAGVPWQAAGGDYAVNEKGYVKNDFNGFESTPSPQHWYPTRIVKEWVAKGGSANHGVLLRAIDETTNQEHTYAAAGSANGAPQLTVVWDRGGMGELPRYTTEDKKLTDNRQQRVNVASGNLLVHETDLTVKGLGMDLVFDRYYNSLLAAENLPYVTPMGTGWNLTNAGDVGLKLYYDSGFPPGKSGGAARAAAFFGPSGYRLPFVKEKSNDTFQRPPGLNADLRYNDTADEYTLTFRDDEERYVFYGSGMLKSHKDKNGNALVYLYQDGTRVSSITDTQGRSTTFTYYTSGTATGKLWKVTDPAYRVHTFMYDGQNLSSYTDPTGAQTLYGYDATGRLNRIKNPENHETLYEYTADNKIANVKYVTNRNTTPQQEDVTTYRYGASTSDLCERTNPDKTYRSSVAHADMPLMTTVVDPNQIANGVSPTTTASSAPVTRYCYDQFGQVRLVRDQQGNKTYSSYNSDGNVTSRINANEAEALFDYQGGTGATSGNLTGTTGFKTTGQTPTATSAQYNDANHPGFPTSTTDARGNRTEYTYDTNGNLTKIVLGANAPLKSSTFRYEYDAGAGALTRIRMPEAAGAEPSTSTTAQGNDVLLEYFGSGNLKKIDYPEPMGDVAYEYDNLSRLQKVTEGIDPANASSGTASWLTYDDLDRLTKTWYPDASWQVTYQYDKVGNVTRRDDYRSGDNQVSTYTYDLENQAATETHPVTVGWNTAPKTTDYTYDRVGNLTQVRAGGQVVSKYTYDSVHVMRSIESGSGAVTTFGHNKLYKHNSISYGHTGVDVTMNYDDAGNMILLQAGTKTNPSMVHLKYDYFKEDGASKSDQGLLQKVKDLRNGRNVVTTYTYDPLNRLTSAKEMNEAVSPAVKTQEYVYTYDAVGNLTSADKTETANSRVKYNYNDANQLTCSFKGSSCSDASAPGTTYQHDRRGNLKSANSGLFIHYDIRDRLRGVDRPGTTDAYNGDYRGETSDERSVRTLTPRNPNQYVKYHWFENDMLGVQRETTDTGRYTTFVRDESGNPYGLEATDWGSGLRRRFFIRDYQGSVLATIDGGGNLVERYDYDPYGNMTVTGADTEATNPWRYAGGYYDESTRMYKMGVRYYDPSIYRFTQTDSVKGSVNDPMTLNPYQYAGCDPINNVDPTGRSHRDIGAELEMAAEGVTGCLAAAEYATTVAVAFIPTIGEEFLVATAACGVGAAFAINGGDTSIFDIL